MTNLRAAMFLELGATTGALLAGRGAAIIMAGLLMLIATPVLRVGVSIFAFLLQEDWVFTIVTAVVFGLLILSFFLGRTGG